MIQIVNLLEVPQHIVDLNAIVFDLDDTLYSEKCYVCSGFNAIAKEITIVDKLFEKLLYSFEQHKPAIDDVLTSEGIYTDELKQKCLDIYRNHLPSIHLYPGVADRRRVEIPGTSAFCGPRHYEEVRRILQDADMVLHVESFHPEQIEAVRYSFSTKITDCLESGGVLTVIGPAGISSVEESRRIPGAIVIDDLARMDGVFSDLAATPQQILQFSTDTRHHAAEFYSMEYVSHQFFTDLHDLLNKEHS